MLSLNIVAVIALLPLLYFGIERYGVIAGAYAWLVLNLGYICVGVPLMHRRYLKHELARWMTHGLLAPFTLVLACCLALRRLVGDPKFADWGQNALTLCMAAFLASAIALLATPLGREKFIGALRYR